MANISTYLQKILSAIYGEEVRGSIHDALAAMNVESSNAMQFASTAKDSAQTSAANAQRSANTVTQKCYIKLRLRDRPVCKVTAADVQALYREVQKNGHKTESLREYPEHVLRGAESRRDGFPSRRQAVLASGGTFCYDRSCLRYPRARRLLGLEPSAIHLYFSCFKEAFDYDQSRTAPRPAGRGPDRHGPGGL